MGVSGKGEPERRGGGRQRHRFGGDTLEKCAGCGAWWGVSFPHCRSRVAAFDAI